MTGRSMLRYDWPSSFSFLISAALYVRFGSAPAMRRGPVDRHLPVPEGGVVEDLAFLGFFECQKSIADACDFVLPEFTVLVLPSFFRSGRNHFVASISLDLALGGARGLRLVSTQTYVAMPVL